MKSAFPSAVWRKDRSVKTIYLTFDDGPVPEATPFVLDLLKQEKINATFFCVGQNVTTNAGLYARILAEGHATGNHTFNHLNGWNTGTEEYLENVRQCAEMVDSKLFRPPYGKLRSSQVRALRKTYSLIMWDVLSGDYDLNTSPEKCFANVAGSTRNGSIIVFHDSIKARKNMEYALPRFITWAKEQNYRFATL